MRALMQTSPLMISDILRHAEQAHPDREIVSRSDDALWRYDYAAFAERVCRCANMPRWWLPDAVIFAPVPLTAIGKIDKKTLRDCYAHHLAGDETGL